MYARPARYGVATRGAMDFLTPRPWDTWWPCIVVFPAAAAGRSEEQLQVYDAEQAWAGAAGSRPWGCHVTKVRRREEMPPLRKRCSGMRPTMLQTERALFYWCKDHQRPITDGDTSADEAGKWDLFD